MPAVQEEGEEGVRFPVLEHEGASYVPAFTSQERAARGAPQQHGWLQATGGELAAILPEGHGLALNPGVDLGVALPAEAVRALSGPAELRFPAGSDVRVGLPANEPPELREAVAAWGATRPDVVAVHRVLVQSGDDDPTLVLGLEVAPGADGAAAVDACVRNLPGVGALVLAEGATDPVSRFMRDRDDPLYRA